MRRGRLYNGGVTGSCLIKRHSATSLSNGWRWRAETAGCEGGAGGKKLLVLRVDEEAGRVANAQGDGEEACVADTRVDEDEGAQIVDEGAQVADARVEEAARVAHA